MTIDSSQLVRILRIGHDVSMRGEGLSLRDALALSSYERLRGSFGPAHLLPLLKASPDLIDQWLLYSEDKRTDGAFWVSRDPCEVGSVAVPTSTVRFASIEEAVAEFVVKELDYWCAVGRRRGNR